MLHNCELRLKASGSGDRLSRKEVERNDAGDVVWNMEDSPSELPVRKRYGSTLIIGFKSTLGIVKSGKDAMAVVWLRDLIDNQEGKIEVALWKAHNFKRLKQNYVPLDGSLDGWEKNRDKYERIGTLRVDLIFKPGVTRAHKEVLDTSNPDKRRIWDEVDRRTAVGLNEKVGEQQDGEPASVEGENTEVGVDETQEHRESVGGNGSQGECDEGSWIEGHDETEGHEEDKGDEGLMERLKAWKQEEHELNLQHRGVMQKKPARTAVWLKDNMEDAAHKVKNRFSMKSRQPGIETEV